MSTSGRQSSIEDMGSSFLNKLPVSSTRRQKVMGYLKAKRDEYISGGSGGNSDAPEDDFSSAARALQDQAVELNEPFPDENIILYRSYTGQLENGGFEVEVRGYLYLPGLPNRKGRIVHSLAKQIAGVGTNNQPPPATPSSTMPGGFVDDNASTQIRSEPRKLSRDTSESLIEVEEDDDEDELRILAEELGKEDSQPQEQQQQKKKPPQLSRTSTESSIASSITNASSSTSSLSGPSDEEARLKERLAPFMARPAPCRRLTVQIGSEESQETTTLKTVSVTTLPSGRFSAKIQVDYKPSIIHVEASEEVVATEEILNIDPDGVSVISDIDDTIKHTGITGEKREMFRNVLIRDYEKVGVDGVPQWFQRLSERGVNFHYVSNSPWQLYSSIDNFLKAQGFPPGSVHLKQYSGFLNGLLEPSSERKRSSLYKILRDFPRRKFILIGDSGEGDLEAYLDIALSFPRQVLAIYIRDVTLPIDDKTFQNNDMNEFLSKTNYIPRPDEMTAYESTKRRIAGSGYGPSQWKSRSTISLKPANNSAQAPPPPPPPPRATTLAQSTSLIDLSSEEEEEEKEGGKSDSEITEKVKNASLGEGLGNNNNDTPPGLPPRPNTTKPQKPPVPRKPVGLRSTSSGSTKPSSTEKQTDLSSNDTNNLSNPYSKPHSNSIADPQFFESKDNDPPPPPLPPRSNTSASYAKNNNSNDPVVLSSTQNDYGQYEVLDKKIENWKSRVTRARCELPAGVRLRMWRKAQDIEEESIIVTDSNNSR